MSTTLRSILDTAASASGLPMKDLTVLSACRDPYRLDTPAGHAKGQWLADAYREVLPVFRVIHLRGLHYLLVGRVTLPDGRPYLNDDATWTWLSEQAVKAARYLGYLPWDALRDARNAPPQVFRHDFTAPAWRLHVAEVEVYLPDELEPRFQIYGDLYRQPWQQIIIAEKQGVAEVLRPLAQRYQATLVLPGGELSDQMMYDLLAAAAEDGRPVAIHQLGDFDPAGHQMAVSTARTAQALRDSQFPDLQVRVHAVGLTLDQCRDWQLPSTPLKETERRGERWREAMKRDQTELDAAVALVPDQFAAVVEASLRQYFDDHARARATLARFELEEEANTRLAGQLGPEVLGEIRASAQGRLEELGELARQVNEALHFDPEAIGIVLPEAPTVVMGETTEHGLPLFDSANDWGEATRRLIGRKQYAMEGQQ